MLARDLLLLGLLALLVGCPPTGRGGDDDDDSTIDDDDDVEPGNSPPTAPVINISPTDPTVWDPISCMIETFSTDPDGDLVAYRFTWERNDEPVDVPGTFVTVELIEADDLWRCTVTPTDGLLDGPSSSAEAKVTAVGDPPSPPVIEIQPASPTTDDDLSCVIVEPSIDPDGMEVVYTFSWYQDGALFSSDVADVEAAATAPGEEWMCEVEAYDLWSSSGPATAAVIIQ